MEGFIYKIHSNSQHLQVCETSKPNNNKITDNTNEPAATHSMNYVWLMLWILKLLYLLGDFFPRTPTCTSVHLYPIHSHFSIVAIMTGKTPLKGVVVLL